MMDDTTFKTAFFDSDNKTHQFAAELLAKADIQIGGSRPWDIRFNAHGVPEAAMAQGNLGFGEAYMNGAWDADELDQFFCRLLGAKLPKQIKPAKILPHIIKSTCLNRQTRKRAWAVGEAHYDLGNAFYGAMLDSRMTYTCGYWKDANTLEEAQTAKLDLICQKLNLQPGMRLLDIGCGWG
ncbi:MAG TPA: class I SAM-dependent methyltransferase, partial [Marinobacter sp.]|nr:class I SAM-dependent methyltransferase [Marinobacter sp.]